MVDGYFVGYYNLVSVGNLVWNVVDYCSCWNETVALAFEIVVGCCMIAQNLAWNYHLDLSTSSLDNL